MATINRNQQKRNHYKESAEDLNNMLNQQLTSVISALNIQTQRRGNEMKMLNPRRADSKFGSFSIKISGPGTGMWADFADGDSRGGGGLSFVSYVLTGNKKPTKEVFDWVRNFLGLETANYDPAKYEQMKRQAAAQAEKDRKAQEIEKKEKTKVAKAIFLGGAEVSSKNAVGGYLAGRGIDISKLPYIPQSIKHCKLQNDKQEVDGMVAPIIDKNGQIIAVHRTFLQHRKQDGWVKADGISKKVLGSYGGGYIPVWRGADMETKKPLKTMKQRQDVHLYITEGIEDALSLAMVRPDLTIIACVSIGNLGTLHFPDTVSRITMIADNDEPGSMADQQLNKGLQKLAVRHTVDYFRMPEGKDINDWLKNKVK